MSVVAVVGGHGQIARILHGELGLEMKATLRFSMALSEACQNIVEHAGTSGWVAVQAYTWRRRLGRRVVVIAVSDSGIGFRHGEYGIKKFCRPESIVITRFGGKREPLWYPYTDKRRNMLRRASRFFTSRDLRRKFTKGY